MPAPDLDDRLERPLLSGRGDSDREQAFTLRGWGACAAQMLRILTGRRPVAFHDPLAFPWTLMHPPCLELIPAVIGAGAADPGTRSAAAALQRRGLIASLGPRLHWGRAVVARGRLTDDRTAAAAARLEIVLEFCSRLANRVSECLLTSRMPLVMGGDHSCAIGTWSGVARHLGRPGRLGLLWIDAHLDAHTPRSSDSKMPHGMPLAALLGEGSPSMTHLASAAPVLQARRVVVLGARSWEPAEAHRLERLGVRVISADEVHERGLRVCMAEALHRVQGDSQPWGLSLDVDAIDPLQAPATGTPVAGGLQADDLATALRGLAWAEGLQAIELAEYNPRLDPDCQTARQVVALIAALMAPPDGPPDRRP